MTLTTYHNKDLVYFGMNLSKDGTNQLPKAGFD